MMYALEHYEEIDDIYRKKQKKKLWSFLIPVFLAFVFAAVSIWGYFSAEQKKKENYGLLFLCLQHWHLKLKRMLLQFLVQLNLKRKLLPAGKTVKKAEGPVKMQNLKYL